MNNTRANLSRKALYLMSLCLVALSGGCKASNTTQPSVTSISFDKSDVKLGAEIHISPTRRLDGWTGEATINTFRARLSIDSKKNEIRVTRQNGFTTLVPNEVCVALKGAHGENIPITNECVHVNVSPPALHLGPESETIKASGGSGRIEVQTSSNQDWQIGNAPEWVTLKRETGDGLGTRIRYTVAANNSYKPRSASIPVGDAVFEITQWGAPYVAIPFAADFSKMPIPVWELQTGELETGVSQGEPPRWVLDNQKGQDAAVEHSNEGPSGTSALVVNRRFSASEAWKTLIWLPGLLTSPGQRYRVSLWLKAESPAQVGLEFGQRTAPIEGCGLFQLLNVPRDWTQFTVDFKAVGNRCGPDNNRFAIHVGRVSGRLWISGLYIVGE